MVNKNYKIQNLNSTSGNSVSNCVTINGKHVATKHYSPPVIRSTSSITNSPNPYDSPTNSAKLKDFKKPTHRNANNFSAAASNIENTYEQLIIDDRCGSNSNHNFGRNIALTYDTVSLASETNHKIAGQHQFDIKDIVCNDMGRFQYIVEMDKEIDPTYYSQPVMTSSSSSVPSSVSSATSDDRNSVSNRSLSFKSFQRDKIQFWRTDASKYRLSTATTAPTFRDRVQRLLNMHKFEIKEHLKTCWDISRWPIFLLLTCLVLTSLIYVIYLGSHRQQSATPYVIVDDHTYFGDGNNLDYLEESAEVSQSGHLSKFIISTERVSEGYPNLKQQSNQDYTPSVRQEDEINIAEESATVHLAATSTTTKPSFRNTKIIKFIPKPGFEFDKEDHAELLPNPVGDKTVLIPVVEPTNNGHAAGYWNKFDNQRAEHEETILKLFNEELIRIAEHESPTTAKPLRTSTLKVSPTLPVIIHHRDTSPGIKPTTETMVVNKSTDDVNACQSTSLEMCVGVLQYDLTTAKSKQLVATMELAHFQYLISSNCSNRAAEFVCSFLEPECRPNGALEPCKRICKSILEPCASVIASSEILTMTFDCDRYPDSSDRNVCEDPTRRNGGKCLDNEFKCLDSSCIPKQWQCDNIKDCSLGEDEENCKFCHHEEFRCHSDSKCIAGDLQCDGYEDCADGSDEHECFDYDTVGNAGDNDDENESGYDDELESDYPLPRIYSFASIQSPDNPDGLPFFAIPIDEDGKGSKPIEETSSRGGGLFDEDNSGADVDAQNESENKNETNLTVKTGAKEESKSLANFQDSTEIMMTSDSEHDFKVSKYRTSRIRNTVALAKEATTSAVSSDSKQSSENATEIVVEESRVQEQIRGELSQTTSSNEAQKMPLLLPEAVSESDQHCPSGELRCISGKCISVDQLCDRKFDCPDGADEVRCIYKDESI